MQTDKLDEFIVCLTEERFYDAHEALESLWFPRRFENSAEVKLLKGFINAAVSFELKKRGKVQQSKRVWKNYEKYKENINKIDKKEMQKYYKLTQYIEKLNKF